jgi:hypothetical protein
LAQQPLDRDAVEEAGVVPHRPGDLSGLLGESQHEVELGGPVFGFQKAQRQTGQDQRLPRQVLEDEHHLEQGRDAEAALGVELLDELLER